MKGSKTKVHRANYRCPRCRAKLKVGGFLARTYTCNRCGYFKAKTEDNLTKKLFWG